jgi:hypothetical protein
MKGSGTIEESLFEDEPQPADTGEEPAIPDEEPEAEDPFAGLIGTDDTAEVVLRKGLVDRIEDIIFGLMKGRKIKRDIDAMQQEEPVPHDDVHVEYHADARTGTHEQKQEQEQDVGSKQPSLISRIARVIYLPVALIVFAAGAMAIYSELPTHPMLVIGIVTTCAASCVIIRSEKP